MHTIPLPFTYTTITETVLGHGTVYEYENARLDKNQILLHSSDNSDENFDWDQEVYAGAGTDAQYNDDITILTHDNSVEWTLKLCPVVTNDMSTYKLQWTLERKQLFVPLTFVSGSTNTNSPWMCSTISPDATQCVSSGVCSVMNVSTGATTSVSDGFCACTKQ
jgi:hypothetical protein